LLQNHGKRKRLNAVRKQLKLSPLLPRVQVPVSTRMLEKYGKDTKAGIEGMMKCTIPEVKEVAAEVEKDIIDF